MAVNTKTVRMTFTNQSGREVSLTIPNPKDTLVASDVTAAMDTIIAKNIFTSSGGDFVSKADAKIIDQNVEDLYTP